MENKFDHIIDYMEEHRIKSIVCISLILIVFFALLIFLGYIYIDIMIPFIIIGILIELVLIVSGAAAIVFSLTD